MTSPCEANLTIEHATKKWFAWCRLQLKFALVSRWMIWSCASRKFKISFSYNLGNYKTEQLSPPPPPPSNEEGAKEQKRSILASSKWGEGWSRCSIYFVQDSILDRITGTIIPLPPPPPNKSNDEGTKEQNLAMKRFKINKNKITW